MCLHPESSRLCYVEDAENMERVYLEAANTNGGDYTTVTENKHYGDIVVETARLKNGQTCFTLSIKQDLFNNDGFKDKLIEETAECLGHFFTKYKIKTSERVLLAGLGNDKVTADSLGGAVCDKILVTSHLYHEKEVNKKFGNLSSLKCGVAGTTGIASYDVLSSVAKKVMPKAIIAVDTLAANASVRLGNCIQISDKGIEPGGGVNNPTQKISETSIGAPVIAIGVPLVIYVKRLLSEHTDGKITADKGLLNLVVAAKEIDFLIKDFSFVIAEAVNRVVHNAT